MDNLILKAKHWQVFLVFAVGYVLRYYTTSSLMGGMLFLVLLVLYVGWYAMLGNTLHPYLPRGAYYNLTWFLLDAFVVIGAYGASLILFEGNMQADGLAALPVLYIFFAIGHLFWFPAVVLVTIENKAEPSFSQYAGTWLQLIFWPIGVWFIQPRLNLIHQAIQSDTLDYPLS